MARTRNRRRISQLEAELMQSYYGDLPWQDLPTEPGYYWFRVVPSIAIHGPTRVRLIGGRLLGEVHSDGGGEKPVEHFQRQWAGPLGRPVPVDSGG